MPKHYTLQRCHQYSTAPPPQCQRACNHGATSTPKHTCHKSTQMQIKSPLPAPKMSPAHMRTYATTRVQRSPTVPPALKRTSVMSNGTYRYVTRAASLRLQARKQTTTHDPSSSIKSVSLFQVHLERFQQTNPQLENRHHSKQLTTTIAWPELPASLLRCHALMQSAIARCGNYVPTRCL